MYYISRLRVKLQMPVNRLEQSIRNHKNVSMDRSGTGRGYIGIQR
jgi:hypothetical protein